MKLITCPECGTKTRVNSKDEAIEKAKKHNNNLHNGNQVAGIGEDAIPPSDVEEGDLYVDPFSVNDMGEDAGPPYDHPHGVRAACGECQVVALFDSELEAMEAVDSHIEIEHNGNEPNRVGVVEWDLTDLPSAKQILEKGGIEALFNLGQAMEK